MNNLGYFDGLSTFEMDLAFARPLSGKLYARERVALYGLLVALKELKAKWELTCIFWSKLIEEFVLAAEDIFDVYVKQRVEKRDKRLLLFAFIFVS